MFPKSFQGVTGTSAFISRYLHLKYCKFAHRYRSICSSDKKLQIDLLYVANVCGHCCPGETNHIKVLFNWNCFIQKCKTQIHLIYKLAFDYFHSGIGVANVQHSMQLSGLVSEQIL